MEINEYLDKASSNLTIYDSFIKAESMLSYYDNMGIKINFYKDKLCLIFQKI